MKNSRLLLIASPLLFLTACGASQSADLQSLLRNPLYAEQYYDLQVEHMVNMLIGGGELLKNPAVKGAIDDTRIAGLRLATAATDRQAEGKMGVIMSDASEIMGEVLLLDDTLYTGPEFQMYPGVDVHVYLTKALDPRDAAFPDDTAIDIGAARTAFGASQYPVSLTEEQYEKVRTAVFYDEELKRVVGFAQLHARN